MPGSLHRESKLTKPVRAPTFALRTMRFATEHKVNSKKSAAIGRLKENRVTLRRVVVGVDGSQGSADALEWALTLARDSRTEVVVVHTTNPAEARQLTLTQLDESCTTLRDAHIAYRCVLIEDSDPRIALPDVAEQEGADLIIVGSRGQNAVTQLVVGSVGLYLTHHAPRPVAIVHPNCNTPTEQPPSGS